MDASLSKTLIHRQTVSRRGFLRYVAGSTGLLLAACAPTAPPPKPTAAPEAAAPKAPSAPAPTAAPAAKPSGPAGSVTIGIPNEPVTADPQFSLGTVEYNVLVNVMDGLFTTGEKLAVVPRLAESYRQIDEVNWEFKLRQGVKFHNGESFSAEAVKVTYERSGDENLKIRNTWIKEVNVDRIDVMDTYTVRFHTTTPTPHMLARLANDHFIYPPKYLMETDPKAIARKPVGTGAYVFKEWASGEKITLEANPEYWGSPKPTIRTVTFKWIPEHSSRLANLKTGAVELMDQLDPTSIQEVNADARLQAVSVPGGRRVYVGLNTKLKPMDNLQVRQALNYGTDIESIARTVLGGGTTRMRTWVNSPFDNPDVKGYSYDPARAKQLLQEAGLGQGFKVTLDYDKAGFMKGEEFPQALAISLRSIGVDVALNVLERSVAAQKQRERTTNELYLRSTAPFFDPGLDFELLRLTHAGNATQWDEPQFQDLFKKLYSGGNPEERKAWSFAAQARLMDQAPMLFLWKQPDIYGVSRKLQGFRPQGDERIRVAELNLG